MTTKPAPTCRDWPAGTRVRCVAPGPFTGLEFTVEHSNGLTFTMIGEAGWNFCSSFEPVSDIDTICSGEWPAGTRVRCVDNSSVFWALTVGREYVVKVKGARNDFVYLFADDEGADPFGYRHQRFKPVVRVPMGRAPAPFFSLTTDLDGFFRSFAC